MARHAAWMRPRYSKIYGLCADAVVARGLSLSWGVTPVVIPFDLINPTNTIGTALDTLVAQGHVKPGHTVVIVSSILVGDQIVDAVQMRVVS